MKSWHFQFIRPLWASCWHRDQQNNRLALVRVVFRARKLECSTKRPNGEKVGRFGLLSARDARVTSPVRVTHTHPSIIGSSQPASQPHSNMEVTRPKQTRPTKAVSSGRQTSQCLLASPCKTAASHDKLARRGQDENQNNQPLRELSCRRAG